MIRFCTPVKWYESFFYRMLCSWWKISIRHDKRAFMFFFFPNDTRKKKIKSMVDILLSKLRHWSWHVDCLKCQLHTCSMRRVNQHTGWLCCLLVPLSLFSFVLVTLSLFPFITFISYAYKGTNQASNTTVCLLLFLWETVRHTNTAFPCCSSFLHCLLLLYRHFQLC